MEIQTKEFIQVWKEELKHEINKLQEKPSCTIIIAKDYYEASKIYVNNKMKISNELGINSQIVEVLWENKSKEELIEELKNIIGKSKNAVMVQDPFPLLNQTEIAELIPYEKDADGFTTIQKGKLVNGDKDALIPCTPLGIIKLLNYVYPNGLKGKSIGIFSRSNLIGKPLMSLALQYDMTPIVIHTKTNYTTRQNTLLNSDIIITGCGKRKLFSAKDFGNVETIIDCSMDKIEGVPGVGDCNKEDILQKRIDIKIASGYGHTGTCTVLGLMENIIKAYKNQNCIQGED